jgi:hypothetical protein
MFLYSNDTVVSVPQIGGMLAYYFLFGERIIAFPEGFRMVAGQSTRREFTLPVPDPPRSLWGPSDRTQEALTQKAVGFNCLNYNKTPEGALERHFLPEKPFLDAQCTDGLRLELMFPSCWDGINLDSIDHRSHVVYPDLLMEGNCPDGFEVAIPALYYETIWDTSAHKLSEGRFVLSNGDYTGKIGIYKVKHRIVFV